MACFVLSRCLPMIEIPNFAFLFLAGLASFSTYVLPEIHGTLPSYLFFRKQVHTFYECTILAHRLARVAAMAQPHEVLPAVVPALGLGHLVVHVCRCCSLAVSAYRLISQHQEAQLPPPMAIPLRRCRWPVAIVAPYRCRLLTRHEQLQVGRWAGGHGG